MPVLTFEVKKCILLWGDLSTLYTSCSVWAWADQRQLWNMKSRFMVSFSMWNIVGFFLCVESSLHTCDSCTWIPTTHCRVTVDFSPTPGSISSAWFWLLQALFECHMCCSFGTVATVHSRADLINVLKLVSGIERCVVVVGIPSWLVCG